MKEEKDDITEEELDRIIDEKIKLIDEKKRHKELIAAIGKLGLNFKSNDTAIDELVKKIGELSKPQEVRQPEIKQPEVKVTTNQELVVKEIAELSIIAKEIVANQTTTIDALNIAIELLIKKPKRLSIVRTDFTRELQYVNIEY